MIPAHIKRFLAEGEGETLDFKQTISSAAKISRNLAAFANSRGGTLLIGVRDNRSISGIRSEDERYMIDLAAGFYCKPEVPVVITEWVIGGKTVLEVTVPEGRDKPYYCKDEDGKWWVYVRVKDKCILASKIMVDVLRRKNAEDSPLVKYTWVEESILRYLKDNERITLRQVAKNLNISRWRASKTLVNLISLGVVRSHTTEKDEFYTLA